MHIKISFCLQKNNYVLKIIKNNLLNIYPVNKNSLLHYIYDVQKWVGLINVS